MSRRLKAARWLRGGVNDKGQPIPLTTTDLAAHPALSENGIGANALNEIEQLRRPNIAPMHFEKIAEALGLPRAWFLDRDYFGAAGTARPVDLAMLAEALPRLAEGVRALRLGPGESPPEAAGTGRPEPGAGAGDA